MVSKWVNMVISRQLRLSFIQADSVQCAFFSLVEKWVGMGATGPRIQSRYRISAAYGAKLFPFKLNRGYIWPRLRISSLWGRKQWPQCRYLLHNPYILPETRTWRHDPFKRFPSMSEPILAHTYSLSLPIGKKFSLAGRKRKRGEREWGE